MSDGLPGAAAASTALFYCDLSPTDGTGHVMRCVALAEELARSGRRPVFAADFDSVPWAAQQVAERGFGLLAHPSGPETFPDLAVAATADVVVVDSYRMGPATSARLHDRLRDRPGGRTAPLLAIVDHGTRGLHADLFVDQNLGASGADYPDDVRVLAGPAYALLRDEVLHWRDAGRRTGRAPTDAPRVLAYFGGTDAFDVAPLLATALAAAAVPCTATFVTPRETSRAAIAATAFAPGQQVEAVGPPPSLMELAARADLVVAASGTSLLELFCIAAAAAVVQVADNQRIGYDGVVAHGLAVGLGDLATLRADPTSAAPALAAVLRDEGRRASLRRAAGALVDGEGRRRVVAALDAPVEG